MWLKFTLSIPLLPIYCVQSMLDTCQCKAEVVCKIIAEGGLNQKRKK